MNNRSRYTVNDIKNNLFYQMPKFLFEGELKKGLSNDAKVLYSLLRDRHELSLQNNWVNENNEVYLIYTRKNMEDMLGLSDKTVKRAIDKLKEYGLIEEERLGLNKPNRIYLNLVTIENTGLVNNTIPDAENFRVGLGEFPCQEGKNFRPNNTNINNTNYSNIDINQSIVTNPNEEKTYDDPSMDGHDIPKERNNKNYYKNSVPVEELDKQIAKVGFKSYKDLISDLQLIENVYEHPYSFWLPTVKKVIWEMYYLDTRIRNRTIGRFDVITKLQDLDIDIVKSSLDKIIEMGKREKITYPVPLLKTIIFNEVDEFMAKIQAQVHYDMNNDHGRWDL